jgi:hypothetical protein
MKDAIEYKEVCPECGSRENFKRRDFHHPLVIQWLLNPGLCFNEIILGQRLPKVLFVCLLSDMSYNGCRQIMVKGKCLLYKVFLNKKARN